MTKIRDLQRLTSIPRRKVRSLLVGAMPLHVVQSPFRRARATPELRPTERSGSQSLLVRAMTLHVRTLSVEAMPLHKTLLVEAMLLHASLPSITKFGIMMILDLKSRLWIKANSLLGIATPPVLLAKSYVLGIDSVETELPLSRGRLAQVISCITMSNLVMR